MKENQRDTIHTSEYEILIKQRLSIAYQNWLGEKSKEMTICVCWHIPNAMRRHFNGYTADWVAKELRRYFNKVDRRIFKAALKNRGIRLQRIITLEHDEEVGWHAHGLLGCAPDMDEQQTITILEKLWVEHVGRFASGKFEKHVFWAQKNVGFYLPYITKRTHRDQDLDRGFLDTMNTSLSNG